MRLRSLARRPDLAVRAARALSRSGGRSGVGCRLPRVIGFGNRRDRRVQVLAREELPLRDHRRRRGLELQRRGSAVSGDEASLHPEGWHDALAGSDGAEIAWIVRMRGAGMSNTVIRLIGSLLLAAVLAGCSSSNDSNYHCSYDQCSGDPAWSTIPVSAPARASVAPVRTAALKPGPMASRSRFPVRAAAIAGTATFATRQRTAVSTTAIVPAAFAPLI